MNHQQRVPQAPSEPLPELAEFLAHFSAHFAQQKSAATLERYLTGLLTEHPQKNCQTLATVVLGTTDQRLNHLLTEMVWDEEDLNRQRVALMLEMETEGDAALLFDDCGFAKQGHCSVGVARQYSGTLGKVGNCQVGVNCVYAERTLCWPVASRLYLPESWAVDAERRQRAQVPEEVSFQTKAEIALALLDEARQCGVPHSCVVADADYGDNPQFLNSLEERDERYCVAVRANFSVARGRGAAHAVERADDCLRQIPLSQWQTIEWREGSRGQLRAKFVAVRCYRVDGDGTCHVGWLIGQRAGRGQAAEVKFFWSNFPASTPLARMVELAHRRHWIEQYHEEAKGELGWDEFQGRRWDGFHRHAVAVMLSYSFLVWQEWQQRHRPRRGRPRAAFSPTTRPPAAVTASGASSDR